MTVDTKKNEPKQPKKQKLRNNEYYDMQGIFDNLHIKACNNHSFKNLMPIISSENNISLAYRNIKNNKGSDTKGTDGRTIEYYKNWSDDKFVEHFQGKLANYQPKSVRRVEIPKEGQPDKTRPLGIPCMDDRIIQQCILQILEPIAEAKFHNHSYGFRPNRATSHAISRSESLMWNNKLHYVVDIDIKGFFDNVNHGKLLKQMWAMGIQDKNLISIIGRILKSEIKGEGVPAKGTPQGGIISPLLSNICLNELDWWLSNQWETQKSAFPFKQRYNMYASLRDSGLKEFFFVRYADDFKIFCGDYKTAQKIFSATKNWLKERLGLEISPEKSKITNVRKGKTEFLGFSLCVKKKGKQTRGKNKGKERYVTRSNISDKAKKAMIAKLKGQIKEIQKQTTPHKINTLNSMILGMHNYYNIATLCSQDFGDINFIVSRSLRNRLKANTKKVRARKKKPKAFKDIKPYMSKVYQKFYGDYKGKPVIIDDIMVFPIYGCKYKPSKNFAPEINQYTPQGRELIHSKLNNTAHLVRYLLKCREYGKSVEYNDNRISLMAGQNGKCYFTSEPLEINTMHCHHKKPKELGGTDEYKNLVWLNLNLHKLIHATKPETINKYLDILNLDSKALKKVNSLRLSAENLEITALARNDNGSI